jgi:hypothetical protein
MDGLTVDSCHVVWVQLHEDLIGTLGPGTGTVVGAVRRPSKPVLR